MTLIQKCQETENTTDTIRSISEYRNSKTIVACSWNNYFILLIYIYIYIFIYNLFGSDKKTNWGY